MAATGDLFDEGPRACPFVALENDRDRRADTADYRHRCFAEPTPAPRALAHQEAYCLSPNFPTCPVFQDWATRAAARPVPVPSGYQGSSTDNPPPEPAVLEPAAFVTPAFVTPPFETPAAGATDDAPIGEPPLPAFEPLGGADEPQTPEQLAAFGAAPAAYVPPPPEVERLPTLEPEDGPPPFLAGREPLMPRASSPAAPPTERVNREDVLPSWEIDGRYGAQAPESGGGDRFGGLITTIAVITILALGVAGVIFLPGLLAGAPTHSPSPSQLPPSGQPTLLPSILETPAISLAPATATPIAEPTTSPTPEVTPQLYRIKAGDSLAKIARRFDTTVEAILAANPQIGDPNHIEVGQRIVIPPPG